MELFKVESCRAMEGCKKAVIDTKELKQSIEQVLKKTDFNTIRAKQMGKNFKQHNLFKICIAGCPNGCSQPQIKDFALIAKAIPEFDYGLCDLCGTCCVACKERGLKIQWEHLILDKDKCLGCGDCWRACPRRAISPGKPKWRLLVGGKLGRHPQLAQEIDEVSGEEGIKYLRKAIDIILNNPKPHQRFADMLKDSTLVIDKAKVEHGGTVK